MRLQTRNPFIIHSMADILPHASAVFDIHTIVAGFPQASESMLLDQYLTDSPSASSRIFRVYRPTPAHYHAHSNEHLLVLSGCGSFWMHDPSQIINFAPGIFLFFERGTIHAMPTVTEYPVTFLAIDTPRRQPTDVIFVDPAEPTPALFIQPLKPTP